LIERVLEGLAQQGITDAVLNLHHLPETVTGIVGDGAQFGLRVRYSWESPVLGSAGGPRHALPLLDADEFFIVNGDTLCDVDLAALAAAHRASGADVTLAVVPNPAPDRYNALDVDDRGVVRGVVLKGSGRPGWHFVGVQIARTSVFDALPDNVPAESVHGVYQGLLGGHGGVRVFHVTSPFVDVGTPSDYLEGALALAGGRSAIEPDARVDSSARVTRSIVWPGASVGANAALDDCIVTNVTVPPGFTARRSILMPVGARRNGDAAREAAGLLVFEII
jgi:NDP-sugar pyrophosphorylase family protein